MTERRKRKKRRERRWSESGAALWRVSVDELKELDIETNRPKSEEDKGENRRTKEEGNNESVSKEDEKKKSEAAEKRG